MSITTQNWDSSLLIPSGWLQDSGNNFVVLVDAGAPSAPNDLQNGNSNSSPGSVSTIYWDTPDGVGGDVIVSTDFNLGTDNGSGVIGGVFGRCTAHPEAWTSLTGYFLGVQASTGIVLAKQTAGSFGSINTLAFALTVGHWYRMLLTLIGTAISGAIQDKSNGQWLTPGGVWQVAQTNCVAGIDSSITGQGKAGIETFTNSVAVSAYKFDNFDLSSTITTSPSPASSARSSTLSSVSSSKTSAPSTSPSSKASASPASSSLVSVSSSSPRVVGTIWYVDSIGGSDSNAGNNPNAPWLTMPRANSGPAGGYIAGDSLVFKGGQSISGSLVWTTSGNQSARCTIGSYGSGNGIISPGNGTGIKALDAEFVTVNNLTISGPGVNSSTGATTSTSPGIDITSSASAGSKWRSVYVDNCTITGTQDGIYYRTAIKNTGSVVGYTDIRITNNTIHGIQQNGIVVWGSATDVAFGSGNFPLGNTTFSGLYIGSNIIYDVYGNPSTSFIVAQPVAVFNTSGGLVERNVMHDCGATGASSGPPGGVGALVILESDRVVCQWNEAYNIKTNLSFDGCAFDTDGGTTNSIFQFNYSHDNDGAGYQTGTFSGSNPNSGNIFRYNVSRNDCRKNSQGALFTFGGAGALFHNNTVYIDQSGASGTPPAINLSGGSGHLFYNNILQTVGSLPLCSGTASQGTFVGNLYWPTGGSFSVFGNSTFLAWQGTGQEQSNGILYGVNADPLLSNPTAGAGVGILPAAQLDTLTYFNLAANSPARGVAAPLPLFNVLVSPIDLHGAQV